MTKINILVLMLVSVLFFSCKKTEINDIDINLIEPPLKEVTLNTKTLLSSVESPILKSSNLRANGKVMATNNTSNISLATDFPEYTHPIPTKFNVYFIYDGKFIKFENVEEGNRTFKIPSRSYKIVATNANMDNNVYGGRDAMPQYSNQLYLYGESTIDYSKVNDGSVELTNDYAAVMLLKDGIKDNPQPTLNGTQFAILDQYYNIYTRLRNGNNFQFTDFTGKQYSETRNFEANKVYRFKVGKDGNLNIIVQDDILVDIKDESL